MEEYETSTTYNIAETCCASISIDDLRNFSSEKSIDPLALSTRKLTYGAIRGSDEFRGHLSHLYSVKTPTPLPKENILITAGAIQANFLLYYTLVGPGDHVICHYPTYQQLYSVPESLGAEVSLWKAKHDDGWALDVKELESLIQPNTKLIILKYVYVEALLPGCDDQETDYPSATLRIPPVPLSPAPLSNRLSTSPVASLSSSMQMRSIDPSSTPSRRGMRSSRLPCSPLDTSIRSRPARCRKPTVSQGSG